MFFFVFGTFGWIDIGHRWIVELMCFCAMCCIKIRSDRSRGKVRSFVRSFDVFAAWTNVVSAYQATIMETKHKAIIDSGCQFCVVGREWLQSHLAKLKELHRSFSVHDTKPKRFRFGNSGILTSIQEVRFEIGLFGQVGRLSAAIVPGSTPLLFSRPALKQLGAILNFQNDSMSTPSLHIENVQLNQSGTGHYLFDLLDFLSQGSLREPSRSLVTLQRFTQRSRDQGFGDLCLLGASSRQQPCLPVAPPNRATSPRTPTARSSARSR